MKLALTGNMSTGGTSIDRTMEAHPDNIEIAETAARMVGLDIAGIDFICPDIATPVRETGGGIVEVNAAPGFRMHTHPTEGEPQYVAKPVIDLLFPPGTPARIPILAVTGTNGKTTTVRMVAHILKLMGRRVGMTSTDGIVIDGRLMKRGDMSGPKSAQMVLQNPTVDTAVFEVARGGILREGLGYDRNDVAVVTNVTGDHLGLGGIDTLGQLANVKGVLVEAVPRSGAAVLNADDRLVYRMGRHCAGRVVLFSMAKEKGEDGFDRVDGHTSRGNAAFCLEDTPQGELIVLKHGPRKMPVLYTHLMPGDVRRPGADERGQRAGRGGRGVGVRRAPPRHPPGPADVHDVVLPGARAGSTCVEVAGTRVVIDYCHNVDGMRQLCRLREPDDGRAADAVRGARGRCRRRRAHRRERAGDRRHRDPRRPARRGPARVRRARRRRRSTRSTSARTRTCAGGSPGETATNVAAGIKAATRRGPGPDDEGREGPRRGVRGAGGAAPRGAGRPRGGLRRRRGGRVPRGDDARGSLAGRDRVRRPGRARGAGRVARARADARRLSGGAGPRGGARGRGGRRRASTWRAPRRSSSANTSSRSAWQNSTTTRGASARPLVEAAPLEPDSSASSAFASVS